MRRVNRESGASGRATPPVGSVVQSCRMGRARAQGAVALVIALVVGGCGTGRDRFPEADGPRYQATTMVLEDDRHGPSLCLGNVLQSFPPQCGMVPVTNWRWDEVADRESSGGTTWATVHVVGTYRDGRFTLTEAPRPPGAGSDGDGDAAVPHESTAPACKAPEVLDDPGPRLVIGLPVHGVAGELEDDPDLAAFWVSGPLDQPGNVLSVVARPGASGRIRAAIRASGYRHELCVVERDQPARRTLVDALDRIVTGRVVLAIAAGFDQHAGVVNLTVPVASNELQQELDTEFGTGIVKLEGALRPIDDERPRPG